MPSWKKLIVSGSDANLNSLFINTFVTASSLQVNGTSDFNGLVDIYKSGSTVVNVEGSSGQLFSITDSLSGSLMSVNDVSGLPILEVFSDDRVILGTFGAPAITVIESIAYISGSLTGSLVGTATTASNISPAIANSEVNRLLTDDGDGTVTAESNLTFNGSLLNVTGDLTVSGKLTAQQFHTDFVSASIIYESGSTKFGDTFDDIHSFTGSISLSGSLGVIGNSTFTGNLQLSQSLLQYGSNSDVDTGTETVLSVSTGSYNSAFFDYVIVKGANARAGTVFSVWTGTSVEFTETSTQDIGDTTGVVLSSGLDGANIRLQATTNSNDWAIRSLVRML